MALQALHPSYAQPRDWFKKKNKIETTVAERGGGGGGSTDDDEDRKVRLCVLPRVEFPTAAYLFSSKFIKQEG